MDSNEIQKEFLLSLQKITKESKNISMIAKNKYKPLNDKL